MKKRYLRLLSALFLVSSVGYAQQTIYGQWLRIAPDQSWVIYAFNQDHSLRRATNKNPQLQNFGGYRIQNNHIFFQDNPEHYTRLALRLKR